MNVPNNDATSPRSDADAPIDAATVHAIVESALRAPSAENTQPWLVRWSGQRLEVRHDRSRLMASDVDSMLDLTGIGAFIESVVLSASGRGLRAHVELSADSDELEPATPLVATLTFNSGTVADPLTKELGSRCTTRRMDPKRHVDAEKLLAIEEAAHGLPGVRISWIRSEDVRSVAKLIGLANRLRFEHRDFHEELYQNLRFTRAEAEQSRDGLDVATLQLPIGVASIMRSLRNWSYARIANNLGFSRAVGLQAATEVKHSGAIGVLSTQEANSNAFLTGGRALQRAWLAATRLGLAFHPTAGLPVFIAYAERTDGGRIPKQYQELAVHMSRTFRSLHPDLISLTPQMMFRIGYGVPPAVRTLRRKLGETLS